MFRASRNGLLEHVVSRQRSHGAVGGVGEPDVFGMSTASSDSGWSGAGWRASRRGGGRRCRAGPAASRRWTPRPADDLHGGVLHQHDELVAARDVPVQRHRREPAFRRRVPWSPPTTVVGDDELPRERSASSGHLTHGAATRHLLQPPAMTMGGGWRSSGRSRSHIIRTVSVAAVPPLLSDYAVRRFCSVTAWSPARRPGACSTTSPSTSSQHPRPPRPAVGSKTTLVGHRHHPAPPDAEQVQVLGHDVVEDTRAPVHGLLGSPGSRQVFNMVLARRKLLSLAGRLLGLGRASRPFVAPTSCSNSTPSPSQPHQVDAGRAGCARLLAS